MEAESRRGEGSREGGLLAGDVKGRGGGAFRTLAEDWETAKRDVEALIDIRREWSKAFFISLTSAISPAKVWSKCCLT